MEGVISIAIKFAQEIVKDMDARGEIKVPNGYVTGEAYERWLYDDIAAYTIEQEYVEKYEQYIVVNNEMILNSYPKNYCEAA